MREVSEPRPKLLFLFFVRYSQVSWFSGKSGLCTGRTQAVRARYAASTCSSSPTVSSARSFLEVLGIFWSRSSIPGFSDCPRVARRNLKSLTWWGIDLVTSSPVPLRVLARQGYTMSRRPVWAALRTRARGPRMPRGIQGLIKSTPVKVYSSLDDVGLEDQLKACPLFKSSTNPTGEPRGMASAQEDRESEKSGFHEGVKSGSARTPRHGGYTALPPLCFRWWSGLSGSPVHRYGRPGVSGVVKVAKRWCEVFPT